MQVTIEISDDVAAVIAVLDAGGDVAEVLREFCNRAHDGITRPRSWERQLFTAMFDPAWLDRVEQDPDVEWRVRPRQMERSS